MKKVTFLTIVFLATTYGAFSQWSNNGDKVITDEKVEVKADGNEEILRLYGDNKDIDFSMGHARDGYGFYWRYRGTQSGNNNDMEFWANNQTSTDRLVYRVKQDGNISFEQKVGIGTTSTGSHLLAVDGSIGAREIIVEGNSWSDFVFEEGYELPSLQQVENYISKKGHLKDIPSAVEIENNGIPLGEMDALLLQKIEELTLYVIEINKQNQDLQREIESLSNANKDLQSLLKNK